MPARTACTSTCVRGTAAATRRSSGCSAGGATLYADHRGTYGPGTGWVTLADPEGNEFCVLRSLAEVNAHADADARGLSASPCSLDAPPPATPTPWSARQGALVLCPPSLEE